MDDDKIKTIEEISFINWADFFNQPKLIDIIESYKTACEDAEREVRFNIFRMLSDYYYRENFHGDILETFLKPEGYHGEGDKFLMLFLHNILGKDRSSYYNAKSELFREYPIKGNRRIDFVIVNENKEHCVIIENKLYDAVDMDNQLPAYVDAMQEIYGKDSVDAVIYLPLSSEKKPDKSTWKENIEPKLEIIPAEKLIKRWLEPSIRVCESDDSRVILRHYKELLESLITNKKKNEEMENLFKYLKGGQFDKMIALNEMLNNMPSHMEDNMCGRLKKEFKGNHDKLKIYSTDWSKCVIEIPVTGDVIYLQCRLKKEGAYRVLIAVKGQFNINDEQEFTKYVAERTDLLEFELYSEHQHALKNALRLVKTFDFGQDDDVFGFLKRLILRIIQPNSY